MFGKPPRGQNIRGLIIAPAKQQASALVQDGLAGNPTPRNLQNARYKKIGSPRCLCLPLLTEQFLAAAVIHDFSTDLMEKELGWGLGGDTKVFRCFHIVLVSTTVQLGLAFNGESGIDNNLCATFGGCCCADEGQW